MRNILFISHEYPPTIGGAGSVAESWIKVLSKENNITLVTRYHKNRNLTQTSLKLFQIRYVPFFFSIIYWKFLRNLFKNNSFDHIILNDSGAAQIAALFFDKSLTQKLILLFHGNELDIIYPSKILHPNHIYRFFFQKLLREAQSLVFVSKFLKEKILSKIDHNNELVNKSSVIYSTFNNDLFYPEKNRSTQPFNPVRTDLKLLTVSRLVEGKGLLNVLNILLELKKRKINFKWTIIGNGPYLFRINEKINENDLQSSISIISNINRADLRKYYSKADIFILLSDFEESFGLVYLESNACGVPVIGYRKGGVIETIENKYSGYLVNNVNEATEIISNWNKYKIENKCCIEFANRFNDHSLLQQIQQNIFNSN
jgi:glycosyltransferase involved in cell wall biosynthesis